MSTHERANKSLTMYNNLTQAATVLEEFISLSSFEFARQCRHLFYRMQKFIDFSIKNAVKS